MNEKVLPSTSVVLHLVRLNFGANKNWLVGDMFLKVLAIHTHCYSIIQDLPKSSKNNISLEDKLYPN